MCGTTSIKVLNACESSHNFSVLLRLNHISYQKPIRQGGLVLRLVLTVSLSSMMLCFHIFVVQMMPLLLVE